MSNRYDSRTTTFSPEGRLFQVEYAMEAVNYSGTVVGIQTSEGIVFLAEKKTQSKLFDTNTGLVEKIYPISGNILVAVAGITSDANTLVKYAQKYAISYAKTYASPIPVEILTQRLCDLKQSYTQIGGMRPFGTGFLYGGWDEDSGEFQLYQSDPSGNYSRWKATCIGSNNQKVQTLLKQEYSKNEETDGQTKEMTLAEGVALAFKVFQETLEGSTLKGEKVELMTIELMKNFEQHEGPMKKEKVFTKSFSALEIDALIQSLAKK